MKRSSIVRLLSISAGFVALTGCGASASDSASDNGTEGTATASQASALSPGSASETWEHLSNGVIKVTKNRSVHYVRANCPKVEGHARCVSYTETDADGKPIALSAPGLSCSGGTGVCLGATDLATAYAIPASTAVGATVAIVGMADNPNFESDMATYRTAYGLPACTSASGCFRKVNESGATSPLAAASGGWVGEEGLDLAMASAGCPSCKILLVEMTSGGTSDLQTAITTAVNLGADVVSFSGGWGEFSSETSYDAPFTALGAGLFASTGDNGGADTTGDILWPAISTAFTGVGGTDLTQSSTATFPNGQPRGWVETGWIQPNSSWGGSGWGCSAYETKPSYQTDSGCSRRTVGDVSAIAGTGVWVYSTPPGGTGGWGSNFGTSVSSPLVAAIYAQTGASHTGPSFSYRGAGKGGFTDITTNIAGPGTCSSSTPAYLCNAEVGYDSPTGNGSPNGSLIPNLSNWADLSATIPANAIIAGRDGTGPTLYVCRTPFEDSLQVGKTESGWGTCDVSWGGGEHWSASADILVQAWASAASGGTAPGTNFFGSPAVAPCRANFQSGLHLGHVVSTGCSVPWGGTENIVASYQVPVNAFALAGVSGATFPASAILAGNESDGTPLYMCLASYGGNTIPGKMHSTWTSCDIGSSGSEVFVSSYQVVVPAFLATHPITYQAGVDGSGSPLGVCNAAYGTGTQVGKFLSYGACNFGYGGSEVSLTSGYSVLE